MYRGEFEVGSTKFTLDIEDTSGTFAWDFPAMVEVSLGHADAVLLVFSVGDRESFEQVRVGRGDVQVYRWTGVEVRVSRADESPGSDDMSEHGSELIEEIQYKNIKNNKQL